MTWQCDTLWKLPASNSSTRMAEAQACDYDTVRSQKCQRRDRERTHRAGQPLGECIESFNAPLRDELLNGEIFYSLREAQIVVESWRRHYNTISPASLDYKPPAPEVFVPALAAWPAALRRPAPPATLAPRPTLN
jgi:hypothetical protein